MANEEQLSILKQGVEVWNRWRKEHPFVSLDFRYANLTKADLRGADFWRADLTRTNLSGANLTKAKFDQAKLSQANLNLANLKETMLAGADPSSS